MYLLCIAIIPIEGGKHNQISDLLTQTLLTLQNSKLHETIKKCDDDSCCNGFNNGIRSEREFLGYHS